MIKIVNKRKTPGGYYIGRGSPLGNPYDFTGSDHPDVKFRVKTREEAIAGFSKHLDEALSSGNPTVCDAFRELQIQNLRGEDVILSCFCDPLPCHGEVIRDKLEGSKYCINWFSNMRKFDKPLKYQGLTFWSPENFYQAMKTEKSDIESRSAIASAPPFGAKTLGRNIKIRADWSEIKEDVMIFALRYKFATGTTWGRKLEVYTPEIVEWNNWGDKVWGKSIFDGEGQNRLGEILSSIKSENSRKTLTSRLSDVD